LFWLYNQNKWRTRFAATVYTQHSSHHNILIKQPHSSRRASNERPYFTNGERRLAIVGRKNYNNVTLGKYNCLYIKLSTRIGNGGSPYRIVQNITKLRSGILCFFNIKLSSRTGNGSIPCNSKLLVKNHALHYNIRKR